MATGTHSSHGIGPCSLDLSHRGPSHGGRYLRIHHVGSTAATHDNGTTVYKWIPQEQANSAVLELANSAYQRRFGKSPGETVTVTAAGGVAVPRDFPRIADEFVKSFGRTV